MWHNLCPLEFSRIPRHWGEYNDLFRSSSILTFTYSDLPLFLYSDLQTYSSIPLFRSSDIHILAWMSIRHVRSVTGINGWTASRSSDRWHNVILHTKTCSLRASTHSSSWGWSSFLPWRWITRVTMSRSLKSSSSTTRIRGFIDLTFHPKRHDIAQRMPFGLAGSLDFVLDGYVIELGWILNTWSVKTATRFSWVQVMIVWLDSRPGSTWRMMIPAWALLFSVGLSIRNPQIGSK